MSIDKLHEVLHDVLLKRHQFIPLDIWRCLPKKMVQRYFTFLLLYFIT